MHRKKRGRKPILPAKLYPNHIMTKDEMSRDLFKKKYSKLDAREKKWIKFHMKYDKLFSRSEIRWLVKMARIPI